MSLTQLASDAVGWSGGTGAMVTTDEVAAFYAEQNTQRPS